jgi:hypothetical protein
LLPLYQKAESINRLDPLIAHGHSQVGKRPWNFAACGKCGWRANAVPPYRETPQFRHESDWIELRPTKVREHSPSSTLTVM